MASMVIRCSRISSLARVIVPPTKLDQCKHLCRALFRSFAFVLQRSCQCIPDLARRLLGATAGDVNGHMGSAEGTAEVGDVPLYSPKVEAFSRSVKFFCTGRESMS